MPHATGSERSGIHSRGPVLVAVAIFPEALFGGQVFFDRDIGAYWLPHAATFVRIIAERAWPLWNP